MEQTQELDIQHYLQMVLKRRYLFAITAAAIITAVVITGYLMPSVYEAKTVVSIEDSLLRDVLKGMGGAQSFNDKASALSTIMKSRTLVLKVLGDLGFDIQNMTQAEIEGFVESAQSRTKITIEFNKSGRRFVDFFTVSFRDRNPQMARDYVNNVVSSYIEGSLGSKREGSSGANKFLLSQIDQYKRKVDKLDAKISVLKKNRNVILFDRLRGLQKRLDELLMQYTEDHPEIVKMKSEIMLIEEEFKASEQDTFTMAGAARIRNQLNLLEREHVSSKQIYNELSAAYEKSEVSTQAEMQDETGTFRIVDPAVLPIKPVSPDRIKIILLGIIGGIACAIGLIMILDFFDKSVKNIDTLRSFGIPVLAVIPHIQDPDEFVKAKRKDFILYISLGLFLLLLGIVMVVELFVLG